MGGEGGGVELPEISQGISSLINCSVKFSLCLIWLCDSFNVYVFGGLKDTFKSKVLSFQFNPIDNSAQGSIL